MNLDHLRAFLVIAEEGSMNRAAARLLRAQPAVGRQVRLLEEALGTPLLERSSTGARPTAAGLQLVEHARRIFRDVAEAEAAMARTNHSPSGLVTVAIPTSLIDQLGVRLFSTMQARYPLVELTMLEGDSHAITQWMRDGSADIALLPDAGTDASLHVQECATQVFCFCGLADNFDRLPSAIDLAEALTYPLALTLHPNRLRRMIDNAASSIGCIVRTAASANTGHLITLMVRDGAVYTIRPRLGPAPAVVDGIAFIPLRAPEIRRSLSVVWSTARALPAAADATRTTLAEVTRAIA
ncbi:MAG: LysR family transcriptional regulator [Ottowia sp.]|uniref:LysR family transcriptional regulator n=1 Tax=Ottowia sp. TaxID=1898956 RepID=UPI003C777BA3